MTNRPQRGRHDHAVHPKPVELSQHESHAGHGRNGWIVVVACTAMMVLLMRGMSAGGSTGL